MSIKKKILISLTVLIGFLIVGSYTFKEKRNYKCKFCHSKKHEYQWFFGSWATGSIPLTSSRDEIDLSNIYNCFFKDEHQHEWIFSQGSPYYFFGTKWGGCALGSNRHMNEFAMELEFYEDFRKYVIKLEEEGKIKRDTVYKLISLSSDDKESALHKQLTTIMDNFMEEETK